MKNRFNKKMLGRVLTVALVLFALTPVLAQGAAAISNANTEIRKYWDPIKLLIQGIGGVVGLIGGLRIYNKWTNGDQDINKEVVGWGGACLFLIIVTQFVNSFFQ